MSETGPVILYAEFTTLEGHESRVAALVEKLVSDVRGEPGNVRFDAWVRRDVPREYVVFEIYSDEASFESHLNSSHCIEFNERLGALVAGGGSQLTRLAPVSGDDVQA
jgi:quinol monooxygenase YgiN